MIRFGFSRWRSRFMGFIEGLQSLILLVIRLFFGSKFFLSGLTKFSDINQTASFFGTLGIPFPEWNAYFVASAESVGGILLLVGLCARPAAALLMIIMIVAYLTAHIESVKQIFHDPMILAKQSPFYFLLATLFIFAFGPGKFSLDYYLDKWLFGTPKPKE